jgi:tripartite ATP-independent transporter DctP family solute receptor
MKRFLFSLILLSVLLGTPPHAASQEIKLATLHKPGSPQRIVADKFKELIETGSAGRFTVVIDPNGIGGKEVEAIEGIQTNSLQMGIIAASAFEDLDPIVRVISFPFLFKDEQQAATLLDGPLGAAILRDIETIGCKGLAFSETGFKHLTNNIRPVKTLDTLSGLKIGIMSSPLNAATWLTLGANPTPTTWPIYSDLEQGVLDGQENPLWIIEAYSFFEVQKYLTLTRHSYIAHIGVASLIWWQTLNQQDQDLIQTAMVQASRYQRLDQRARERARLALFKSMGMDIDDEPDTEAFRSKTVRLKEMGIYREPRVQVLLAKMQEAVFLQPEPALTTTDNLHKTLRRADITEQKGMGEQPTIPESTLPSMQTTAEVNTTPSPSKGEPPLMEAVKPGEAERQPTALELLDAPRLPQKPVQIIHTGKTTGDGESLPPIIEERIQPSPDPVNQPPSGSPLVSEPHQLDAPSSQTRP